VAGAGAGAPGTAGAGGTAGAPGRSLGAGCTDDPQCASGVCVKTSSTATSGTCCDKANDVCNTCVGGYSTPVQDGTTCAAQSCDSTGKISTIHTCASGVCTATTTNCQQRWCFDAFSSGNQIACAANTLNSCLSYAAGSNDLGCACGASPVGDPTCP
jgi:hypothetical protein